MMHEHTHSPATDKVTFGFWVYLMSDCVLFAGLFATYAVLHTSTFGGPVIAGIVNLPYVLAETLLLLTSSFTMGIALLATQQNKKTLVLGALCVTLVLGLAFLGMEVSEFRHLISEGAGPNRSAFLSAFFTLLGTHGLHVGLGAIWMMLVIAHVAYKGLNTSTNTKLACLALFWHFLDIIWICIFTFVYLFGAL
ncbi:MAG TPA: cytochrome o ubiquinol oxidase subunit III [Candidatus Paceibacterota bacterium]|jgi:cytochrome o ubiquinol oxidase subunit 3|nr:cytochrome o ubiquinol oxidase subunit III [Candidatus Paceibacterota bacterium]